MKDENKVINITESIGSELLNPSLDLSIDYTEIALDSILSKGILREIPLVKTIATVAKTGILIKEKWFLKKLLIFIKEFNSGIID